jgi:hypothetical protein
VLDLTREFFGRTTQIRTGDLYHVKIFKYQAYLIDFIAVYISYTLEIPIFNRNRRMRDAAESKYCILPTSLLSQLGLCMIDIISKKSYHI